MHVRQGGTFGGVTTGMVWVTDALRVEHWVTDEAMTLGKFTGTYVGLCGEVFLAASLAEIPLRRCLDCVESTLLQ